MRLPWALAGAMLLQAGSLQSGGSAAQLQSLRYVRVIRVPDPVAASQVAANTACAVLDTAALAHSASRSGDDLRVFAQRRGAAEPDRAGWVETPFLLTESEAAPGDAEPATVENLEVRHGLLSFDLAMPRRAYTTVVLHLAAPDYVGTAKVWGLQAPGTAKTEVGSFVIFDLSGEHLARWTSLPLQELQFALLHIELSLKTPKGRPLSGISAATVQGADVPPSREAQTLYTQAVSTEAVHQQGTWTVTRVRVPAHVPIERLSFVLDPHFTRSFRRAVTVVSMPVLAEDGGSLPSNVSAAEAVDGEIWRVTRSNGNAGQPPIRQSGLSMDTVLASNLRSPAEITIAVKNGEDAALPLREVRLEMRQRRICFQAAPGELYTLRYGDAGLAAPSYDLGGSAGLQGLGQSTSANQPLVAQLGPEWLNPTYVARSPLRPFSERHPELLWMGLLASTTLLGVLGGQSLKRHD